MSGAAGAVLLALLPGLAAAAPVTRVWTTMSDFAGGHGYAAGATLWENATTDAYITVGAQQEYAPDPTAGTGNWFSRDKGEGMNWRILRFDPSGNPAGSIDYNSPASEDDSAAGIGLLPGGGFVAAGWEERPDLGQGMNMRVRRYDATGALVAQHDYDDPDNAEDRAWGVAVDPATGNYAIAGFELRSDLSQSFNAVFRLYGPADTLLGSDAYNGPDNLADEYRAVAFNAKSGGWAAAGYETRTAGNQMDWLISRYNAAGTLLWSTAYAASDGADDQALAVATSPVNGNIVVAGYESRPVLGTGRDWLIRTYNASGGFVSRIGCDAPVPSQDDGATAAVIDTTKSSWVAGWEFGGAGDGENMVLRRYDAAGALVYSFASTGPVADGNDRALAVAATAGGAAVMAGYVDGLAGAGVDNRWRIVQVRPRGAGDPPTPDYVVFWATSYDGPVPGGDDRVAAVASAPTTSVYAAGWMDFGAGFDDDWVVKQISHAGTSQLWSRTLDGAPAQGMGAGGEDRALAAAIVRPSTSVYVVGYATDMIGATGKNWVIRKFGVAGSVMLESTYDGPGSGEDIAYAVGSDAKGNFVVAGEADMGGLDYDWVIIRYDATGTQVGPPITYDSGGGQRDSARAISVRADGSFFVAGWSDQTGLAQGHDWAVRAYDTTGAFLWMSTYNTATANLDDEATAISAFDGAGAGRVVIAGTANRTDLAAGLDWRIEWSTTWGAALTPAVYASSSCTRDEVATAVAVDVAGNIVAGGWEDRTDLNQGRNWTLRKYTAGGALLWQASFDGDLGFDDELTSVAVDGAGNVYAGGYAQFAGSLKDYVIRKYDSAGTFLWQRRIDSAPGYFNPDVVRGLAVDAAGNVTVAGEEDRTDLTQLSRLPFALTDHAAVRVGNRIYVIGGTEKVNNPCIPSGLNQCAAFVRFATIEPSGRLGPWTRANYLFGDAGPAQYPFGPPVTPTTGIPIIDHAAVAVGNRIYVVGGRTACTGAVPPTSDVLDTVYSAVVDPVTGHTSPWEVEIPLALAGRKMGLVYTGGALFAVGGAILSGGVLTPTQFVQKAEIFPSGKLYSSNKLRWDGVLNLPVGSPNCSPDLCKACTPSACSPCTPACVITANECLGWMHFTAFSMMRTIAFMGAGYQSTLTGTPCTNFAGAVYGWLGDDNKPVSWQSAAGTAPLIDAQPFAIPVVGNGTMISVAGYNGSSALTQILYPPLGVAKGIFRTGGGDDAELRPAIPKTNELFAGLTSPTQFPLNLVGAQAVTYGDFAYMIGGVQAGNPCNETYRARFYSTSWYVDAGSWLSPPYDLGTTVNLMRVAWSMSKTAMGAADDWATVRYRVAGADGVWSVWSPRIPEAGAVPSSTGYYTFASDVPGNQPFFKMPLAPGINRFIQFEVSLYNDNGGFSDGGSKPTLPRFDEFRIMYEPAPPPTPLKAGCPLEAYPNPARDRLTVRFEVAPEGGEVRLRVYNTAAQLVGDEKYSYVAGGVVTERLDVAGWAPGAYVIVVDGVARGGDPGLYCTETNARFKRLKEKFVIRR